MVHFVQRFCAIHGPDNELGSSHLFATLPASTKESASSLPFVAEQASLAPQIAELTAAVSTLSTDNRRLTARLDAHTQYQPQPVQSRPYAPPSASTPRVDRPVASDPQPSTANSCLFVQSSSWSPVPICLKTSFSLPCRTEVTVVGKISQNSQIRLDMVIPIENESVPRNIHAAYSEGGGDVVVHHNNIKICTVPCDKGVPYCPVKETGEIALVRGDGVPNGEDMGNLAENGDHQHITREYTDWNYCLTIRPGTSLVKTFGENAQETILARTVEELMRIVEEIKGVNIDRKSDNAMLAKINSSALTLWNLSVAMRNGKKANNLVNAKARYVACQLTFLASTAEMTEMSYRRQISMSLKTGKTWLDCGNMSMAESCFLMANECWSKLQMIRDCRLVERKSATTASDEQQMQECEINMLKVFVYRSEVAIAMSNEKLAVQYIQNAKELLSKHPKQGSMIATFCYNFGVEYFQKAAYDNCIVWLRESYEISKGHSDENDSNQKMQATSLRLIAKAYFEIGGRENMKQALNSVDLSIAEESNPKSFYLKLRILLELNEETDSQLSLLLEETLNHACLKMELALQIVKVLVVSK
eukprot:gene8649-9580_t